MSGAPRHRSRRRRMTNIGVAELAGVGISPSPAPCASRSVLLNSGGIAAAVKNRYGWMATRGLASARGDVIGVPFRATNNAPPRSCAASMTDWATAICRYCSATHYPAWRRAAAARSLGSALTLIVSASTRRPARAPSSTPAVRCADHGTRSRADRHDGRPIAFRRRQGGHASHDRRRLQMRRFIGAHGPALATASCRPRTSMEDAGLFDLRLVTTVQPSASRWAADVPRRARVPTLDAVFCNNDDIAQRTVRCNRAALACRERSGSRASTTEMMRWPTRP